MIIAIILAAGKGSRIESADRPKQYLNIDDKPMLVHTAERFLVCEQIDYIVITVHKDWIQYTEGLFNSLPNVRDRKAMLKPIKGLMPDPSNLPKGCAFAPRCEYAGPECMEAVPPLELVSGTHRVACTAYERPGFMIDRRKNHG